jgi:transposase
MYILSTGCQWRAIPKDLPPKSTIYDYFDLWTYDGTLEKYPFGQDYRRDAGQFRRAIRLLLQF